MTDLSDRHVEAPMISPRTTMTEPLWRPFEEDPLLTPTMALGWDATTSYDRDRLARYLGALVSARRAPVHVNVAFNAVYFGYDVSTGGYVGGPLDLFAFPQVRLGESTEALPVGAMVNIDAGDQPLFAEIVYKERAHPALEADGAMPDWLSGAPSGMTGPGTRHALADRPVVRERLIIDPDAFGQGLSVTPSRLERLRQRGRWLDTDGHLLLDAHYATPRDAELDDIAFYAQYLLTRGRDLLRSAAAPLPLTTVLSDDASEEQLAAALVGMLRTVADALASLPELRIWHGYAFTRRSLTARLRDTGPLGGDDLGTLAVQLARNAVPSRLNRWAPSRRVTYTAVGPRLRGVRDGGTQLSGVDYALTVCHANAVISDYARREMNEKTGLLPGQVHLRLDDPGQGGGVWRAEHPDSKYVQIDVTEPLGLGWLSTLPPKSELARPEPQPDPILELGPELIMVQPESEDAGGLGELTITDSQITWTQALRLIHLLEGRMPLPAAICTQMRDAGLSGVRLRLMLSHDGYDLDSAEATQTVETDLFANPQMTRIEWPLEFFAGIVLTCTWGRGAGTVRASTALLERPVTIDEMTIEHRYDPRIVTRDAGPGQPRHTGRLAGTEALTLPQRVLRAVRRLGLLDPAGRAVLCRAHLPAAVYGTAEDHAIAELEGVVDALLATGDLRGDVGSVSASGQLCWPLTPGAPTVPLVIYEPRPVQGPARPVASSRRGQLQSRFVRAHPVAGHLRRIGDLGWKSREEARQAYREDRARFRLAGPAELPDGYTYIRPHSRGTS
ncbi:hypothetical protein SAMN05444920_14820 [Nonomuraea solani]|uniref:Uncharacterized protein n=1 Tax=Nonomuraea solani TaxID=1144553 RepID=A0A1H6F192_9ACTN|nr:hypothetical protein [Nonomuraea solani]SEH03928.1 hypothetical protein SAMN05444920_14820 [Nonomuraea solani]